METHAIRYSDLRPPPYSDTCDVYFGWSRSRRPATWILVLNPRQFLACETMRTIRTPSPPAQKLVINTLFPTT